MQILRFENKRSNIIYTVKTQNGNIFSHSLYKDTPTYKIRKVLKILEEKIDNQENK
ncbi:hypothetical protein I6D55_09560 [Staphylococcus aureus]|uniref:hypothetical protein n=1 Tax=Staphylococcus aureus TaxID=1280 RepID=UPI000ABFD37B|nr:hypothetical protein [Staphylococcus aureus]MBH4694122.1 hypothetical protein [Staphylococcus aureus]MBH4696970.1 hypothetical protein [Staphylococcus aureus]MBH4702041.1 hypothetical protein [Staphylococcus aureus]MBH4704778.1 hypothetical protein [Staphylococcus aureus]MBH4707587.1 hypothetical protein [Staphylococcus aureus]